MILFIFISAFDIADITGYIKLLRPAAVTGRRKGWRKLERKKPKT